MSVLSVNSTNVRIIFADIFEKMPSGGLKGSFSINFIHRFKKK